MTAPSDERVRLAWHDSACHRGKACPRRDAHAGDLVPEWRREQLRGFVDALLAVPDEVSGEDLRVAEQRMHLLYHIAQADGVMAVAAGLRGAAVLLWAARTGKLDEDPQHATKRISADEVAATVLGRRDDVPVRCMDIMDGRA